MSDQRIERIEQMVSNLVLSVGTLKAYFEEEREENQRRFEQIDRRLDKMEERLDRMDKRFDDVLLELRSNKREHDYMAARLFRAEMELDNLKEQLTQT